MRIPGIAFLPVLFILHSAPGVKAQSAILPAGGEATGPEGAVSYSIGQIDYTHFSGQEGQISLGVQQSYILIMVNTENTGPDYSAVVYPNPVSETLTLQLNIPSVKPGTENSHLELYDAHGALLLTRLIGGDITQLPVDQLPGGAYFLKVTCQDKEMQTFKIFKTN